MSTPEVSTAQDDERDWRLIEHPDDPDDGPEGYYRARLTDAPQPVAVDDGKAAGRATFIR